MVVIFVKHKYVKWKNRNTLKRKLIALLRDAKKSQQK